jgi:hypothetical protein
MSEGERKSYASHLVLVQADDVPLFVLPDCKWEIFYSHSIDTAHHALAGALFAAGTNPSSSGAHIRVPLSADSTKRALFEVVRAIWQVNSGRQGRGKVPSKVVARLVESVELATKQKILGGR